MSAFFNINNQRSFIPATRKTTASSPNSSKVEKGEEISSTWFANARNSSTSLDQAIKLFNNFKQKPTDQQSGQELKQVLNLAPESRNALFNAFSQR